MTSKILGFEQTSVASLQDKKVKDGWLKKFGGRSFYGSFKKRWVVMTRDHIFYFKSKEDKQPKSYVDLSKYENIEVADDKKKADFCWRLYNTKTNIRPFYFAADSYTDMENWMKITRDVMKERMEQKRTKALSSFIDSARFEKSIYIRVAEARNLVAMDHGGSSDPYCILQVGSAAIRTQTIWKNLSPFWGEEYNISLNDENMPSPTAETKATHEPQTSPSSKGHIVTVTIFDEDLRRKDDAIGKVEIPLKQLLDQVTREQWYPLTPQDYKNFVSGEVQLEIKYVPPAADKNGVLSVKVIEARNLAPKDSNGLSDPFVKLRFAGEKKKTEIVKKNLNPVWNMQYEFPVTAETASSNKELEVTIWDWDRLSSNDFMGQVAIPLESLQPHTVYNAWYLLSGNPELESEENSEKKGGSKIEAVEEKTKGKTLGDIRLKIKYSEQKILPSKEYNELAQLIEEDQFSVIHALGDVTAEREAVSKTLVRFFQAKGKAIQLLNSLTGTEVDNTPSPDVIFRGNSLATKSVDAYMKLIGSNYLRQTLHGKIKEVSESKKSCEVDPMKIEKGEDVEENAKNLLELVKSVVDLIFDSLQNCPIELRELFSHLQSKVRAKYGDTHVTRYTAVSGFIFLRFWGPAILGPKLFGLIKEHPDKTAGRTLTLVAKTVQNLGNLVEFGGKEPYMNCMNQFIVDNTGRMKDFIDRLSTLPSGGSKNPTPLDEIVDVDKELATLHHYLNQDSQKLQQVEHQTTSLKKLPEVLHRLNDAYKKY